MLRNLKIENIAVIESADIAFEDGLNIMTGETGAGKSIVIDAISAILGERTSKELVRTGCDKASVTALFEELPKTMHPLLEELGLDEAEDDQLLIRRTISADGKNVCRVNGCPVTVGMLKSLGRELVNIHGQHDSQKLLNPQTHIAYLDTLIGAEDKLAAYRSAFEEWKAIKREIRALQTDESEKQRRIDLLDYQINEIEAAELSIGEMDELKKSRSFYRNSEKIMASLAAAHGLLSGGDETPGALVEVRSAADELDAAAGYYDEIEPAAQQLRDLSYQLDDVSETVRGLLDDMDYDPKEAQQVEDRLDYLNKLSRKYGADEEAILQFCEACKKEREEILFSDERLVELTEREKKLFDAVKQAAAEISKLRQSGGELFSEQVCAELSFLDMPNVTFEVQQIECELNENGCDSVEFLISPNLGEAPKPLAKIASGGELSRIMLAIKNVLSDKDAVGTLIFDEIDTGVSGHAAVKLGRKLHEAAKGRQVICVTHLAQIAAKADHHFGITKTTANGKTYTDIRLLDWEERKRELARILSGEAVTQAQLDLAHELLTNP
ncbi:MAG: DNA repair protein RecN [Clostridia bacterium]|nr:DNA repair protein RecN [Clostridia bacterium]